MKVVEFPKGEDEPPKHMGKHLLDRLDKFDIAEFEDGDYTLVIDGHDTTYLITNQGGPGDALVVLEKGKMALMAETYGFTTGD